MRPIKDKTIKELSDLFTDIVCETNGIGLYDTLDLLLQSPKIRENSISTRLILEFQRLLTTYHQNEVDINTLLDHPMSKAIENFFKSFPLTYREEHIHLTGSLTAEFIFPRLKKLLDGPNKEIYEKKIKAVYGDDFTSIKSPKDVDALIRLKEDEQFEKYLQILMLPKLVLNSKEGHAEAAYHMGKELFEKYNVGHIRLKFTYSRTTQNQAEIVPGLESLSSEDVVLGLYDGFMNYKKENPKFNFILSPSFRKEADFFDGGQFKNKKDHFLAQVRSIIQLIEKHPELSDYLVNVDTVGDEKNLYRKEHFLDLKPGLRKLQFKGFQICSHHGEVWQTLKKGVQAVDNAMNIWHIDTLEHGLSLGINPNFYFHTIYQKVLEKNSQSRALLPSTREYNEVKEMLAENTEEAYQQLWNKLINGIPINKSETTLFTKVKFYTALEVERYQHDILNRMINKGVSLTSLPSSNKKLTDFFPEHKDHPFSWWEKKGLDLKMGTDNYITLSTNYIQEMLILLYSDPEDLKITKLLMVTTGETRRPLLSTLMWNMRTKNHQNKN